MKDRYLYRAKRKDNGEWVQGYLYGIWEKRYILWGMTNDIPNMIEVDPSTICRCTGLEDKNGKLIWENDIVNCLTEECCGYIGWNESEAGFYFNVLLEDGRFEEEHIYDYQDGIEVIGNIFDNPELLESEG
nr:MAG TPA: YopX protein [Bacteriophage sp.]